MRLLGSSVLMFVALAFLACAPAAEEVVVEEAPTVEADVRAIEQLNDQVVAAVNAGDLEAWLALYADDAVIMPPSMPVGVGKEAVRAWGQELFGQFDMEETESILEIQVAGDWAFLRATYEFQATPKAGGESASETGKHIAIFKRQSDGTWRFATLVWNTDSPPAP